MNKLPVILMGVVALAISTVLGVLRYIDKSPESQNEGDKDKEKAKSSND